MSSLTKSDDSPAKSKRNPFARMVELIGNQMTNCGTTFADFSERWFPHEFVFTVMALAITCGIALTMGRSPVQIAGDFGDSLWSLKSFTISISMAILSGYVFSTSPPMKKVMRFLASVPKTPRGATVYVAMVCMSLSLVHWALSLVAGGILVREICKRIKHVDYRALGTAAYLGLGSVWALGASSSAALMMNSKTAIPDALYKISGIIPLTQTLLTWQNLVMIVVLLALDVWVCFATYPRADKVKTIEMAGIKYEDDESEEKIEKPKNPGEMPEYWPIIPLFLSALGLGYLGHEIATKGWLAVTNIDNYNVLLLFTGIALHWRLRSFIRAFEDAVKMVGGVLLQFMFYAGLFGVLTHSGFTEVLTHFLVSVSTQGTLPVIVGVYSAVLGVFLPSGGGKWVVEAPYLLEAAKQLHVNLGWVVQCYNAAEALPDFINPIWMLPLLRVIGAKARDLAGFCMVQLVFNAAAVLFMLWALGQTMSYVAPLVQ